MTAHPIPVGLTAFLAGDLRGGGAATSVSACTGRRVRTELQVVASGDAGARSVSCSSADWANAGGECLQFRWPTAIP